VKIKAGSGTEKRFRFSLTPCFSAVAEAAPEIPNRFSGF
jgi:hypothetical protein